MRFQKFDTITDPKLHCSLYGYHINAYLLSLSSYLDPDPHVLLADMRNAKSKWHEKYAKLTEAIGEVVDNFSLVRFCPLNIKDEESIENILITIDNIIQYGEDADVKIRDFDEEEPDELNGDD